MRSTTLKAILKTAVLAAAGLLLTAGASFAQSVVNLTAAPAIATLPDGQAVPMWGYTCNNDPTLFPPTTPGACSALNPNAGPGWSPMLITVPAANGGASLTINLTNNLPAPVPTSLIIVGTVGGGLGTTAMMVESPTHAVQGATWPIAGDSSGATFTPPPQGKRVQSFATEVANGLKATGLSWTGLEPGTYLIESGTHPSIQGPMGLYGVLVVTTAPASPTQGTAYPGVSYNGDVVALLSEIDAAQNQAVAAAVATAGFSETSARVLRDSVSSVSLAVDSGGNVINAGMNYAVGDTITFAGGGFSVAATAHVDTVDLVTKAIVSITVDTAGTGYSSVPGVTVNSVLGAGAQIVAALSLTGVMCSDGKAACYPPAVNYDPRYYLVNGIAFDKTNPSNSLFNTTPATATGNVLVRFVNAGLRMHVPSIVGALTNGAAGAVAGFSLIAEDAHVLPDVALAIAKGNPLGARVQSEVFLPAGKVYDVMINAPAAAAPALPVFDRQLSLSTNNQRDGGMQAYISVNGGAAPTTSGLGLTPAANPDSYFLVAGKTLTVSDPAKGVIANDVGVYGVQVLTAPTGGTVTLNSDGTFTYVPNVPNATTPPTISDSFTYCANGTVSATPLSCSSGTTMTAKVTLAECTNVAQGSSPACLGGAPTAADDAYTSTIASRLQIAPPGVLANDTDPAGHPLCAAPTSATSCPTAGQTIPVTGGTGTVTLNPDGSFTATLTTPPVAPATAIVTFQYNAVNSQNMPSASPATVMVTFSGGSGLQVHVLDGPSAQPGKTPVEITDYRWIIEEDRTFVIDPNTQVQAGCTPVAPATTCTPPNVPSLGTNFHTSYMPLVAAGCVGTAACESGQTLVDPSTSTHNPAVCDVGNGGCRTGVGVTQQVAVNPSQVHLDPAKHYYISILPGDAGNDFTAGAGAPVPVNSNNPSGPQRQFSIALDCPSGPAGADFAPGTGACGHGMGGAPIGPAQFAVKAVNVLLQETPLPTAKVAVFVFQDDWPLNGEPDAGGGVDNLATQETGLGGFEITLFDDAGGTGDPTGQMTYDMFNIPLSNSLAGTIDQNTHLDACPISKSTDGLVGMIVTCPHFESDGVHLSPLEGQAVIANMMPGRYGVVATPAADRIARGEEWLQTNTLDGQKAHDSFIKIGGPAYFQEFGPAGYHVSIGFANAKIINGRRSNGATGVCDNGAVCSSGVTGKVTTAHVSRTPDQRIYSSGSNDALSFTQCYVSLGDPDGMDFAFTKCNSDGTFTLSNLPAGDWRMTIFDQWNDQIVDGLSTPVRLAAAMPPQTANIVNMGDIPVQHWHTNIYTQTYFDQNGNGIRDGNEPGLTLLPTNIRFRDGSYSNFNNTDLSGNAGFNEIFPLFNWYVIEADTTRYKQTGVHVVYDAGGPVDAPGTTNEANYASTTETVHLPPDLRVPGAVYCDKADCTGFSIQNGPASSAASPSTGRIDPPWVTTEGWQGYTGQSEFIEFGKAPFAEKENGGIHGEVIYASTRPFDDPALLIHTSWTPDVPGVTINLYQEGTAPDGTQSLKLVDTTKTTSWDDWAQGFHVGPTGAMIPNMNCPGQGDGIADLFFYTLKDSTQWLDPNNPKTTLPHNSQFKCYDGMHNFNQIQPAPYDGMYKFPSVTSTDPMSGRPTGTSCTMCVHNPASTPTNPLPDILPPGKYVVEVIVPPGYELVKEEDKNILIGDNYIAPVTQQFGGLASIFILPDQAEVNGQFNPNNPQNPTQNLGSSPRHEGDTGSVETFWPCVGQLRIVPDYISLFPQSKEVSPFAGASRHLCDRKEVTLEDQSSALAKFWVFSSTHVAAHYTGFILDDFSSEFDPFSPQFGEKFAVPNLPVSIKDFSGAEIARVYSDQWGQYNGLNYSTWEVNPPNPTGYAPTMMVTCMNDPGPIPDPAHPGQMITDPLYNPSYSQFCYENPYMPGQTQYMDTPVVPTAAFAEGYNPPDCAYPDTTPAVKEVDGDGVGPWVSLAGNTLTITALGDRLVPNNAYSGPSATAAPYNQKFITRHYGFGTQCTAPSAGSPACNTLSSVTIGGVSATVNPWSDTQITVTVPTGIPACAIQQAGFSGTLCGELVITAGNGKKSIDTVTVTVGGKAPTYVTGENAQNNAIQTALDKATPGDLIIVGPGTYNEMLLMWKPVRLQGVGAASVTVNANTHPSGRIDTWRRQVNCLFGLSLNGGFISAQNPFDPNNTFPCDSTMQRQVDPIPLEPVVGWDPTLNGNIAELLQEPTLMGAYEGAGITVLAKGVQDVKGLPDPNCTANGICTPLTNSAADCAAYPSNFKCNPSRIDGMTFTDSSAGGGGIFLHGWNHSMEVSNNRVFANSGTLTGGITVGQMETIDGAIVAGQEQALLFNRDVHVHHNSVTHNAAYGDELNSTTPGAAGGVTFCTGSDYYRFNYNWVCGNLSAGDGGGFAHFGFSNNGNISNNWFLFNQSNNPTIPTHGGGVAILGAPPDGTICENATRDQDCPPQLTDGIGLGLVIDSNLIMGNTAESGSGGGLRLQAINGTEVARNPGNPGLWYGVRVTNNIIANNVAGWDGAGVALQDALKVDFINNTVVSNDTTASSGVLFTTGGAANSSVPPPGCTPQPDPTQPQNSSCLYALAPTNPQPAGLSTAPHTSNMNAVIAATPLTCPVDHPNCGQISYPLLANDVFWQNRSFYILVGGLGSGPLNQQNLVTLVPELNQATTGACPTIGVNTKGNTSVSYWDIGVQGDTGPSDHSGAGVALSPQYSVLTDAADYTAGNNFGANPTVISQYCNGSRVPPENGGLGYTVPAGISDATLPNPIFSLKTAATVDEGNNWVNMSYGPLSLSNPSGTATLGNYALAPTSPAIDAIPSSSPTYGVAPITDFFGNPRPDLGPGHPVDVGAVEFQAQGVAVARVTPTSLAFGTSLAPQTLTLSNTGGAALTGIIRQFTGPFSRPANSAGGTCNGTLAAGASCTINVVFQPAVVGAVKGALTITANVPVIGSPVSLTGTGVRSANLAPATWSPSANRGVGPFPSDPFQVFTLTNTGNMTLTAIAQGTLSGATEFSKVSVFGFVLSTCGPSGNGQLFGQTTLAPGAGCYVTLQFRPPANDTAGVKNATLSITDAAGTQTSALSGTVNSVTSGSRSPASLTFAGQLAGITSAAQTVTVTNTGSVPLPFAAPAITGTTPSDFSVVSNNCGTSIPVNGNCQIGVTFHTVAATAVGTYTAVLNLGTLGGTANVTTSLSGTVAVKTLTPNPVNFPNTNLGSTSAFQTVTLRNPLGAATLMVNPTFGGTNPNYFRRSTTNPGNCPTSTTGTLAAGSSCTIGVVFAPPSATAAGTTGAKSATLTAGGLSTTLLGTAQ